MRFLFREAFIEDAQHIADLVNEAYRPAPGSRGWTHESGLMSGKRIDPNQVIQAIQTSTVLVAVFEAGLAGCVQIQADGRNAHIGMLAVLPSIQAAGLGKKLLAEAERHAQTKLAVKLFVLLVVSERRELIEFYRRRGYEETGESQAYPRDAGVGEPLKPNIRLAVLRKPARDSACARGDRVE